MSNKAKVLAIIQARTGSTRFPGKVLKMIEGKTVLEHVIARVQASKLVNATIVATTVNIEDLAIVKLSDELQVSVYCGSEDDVLDRFYQAAKPLLPTIIVRITADCPLIDPSIIDQTIDLFLQSSVDYVSSQLEERLPDGEDVEVFSFTALFRAWREARLTSEREHVTPYIRNNPASFKVLGLPVEANHSQQRWTLDNREDYDFIKIIYARLYSNNHFFGMKEILALLSKEPGLADINKHIGRNEGYVKSLREDKLIDEEVE